MKFKFKRFYLWFLLPLTVIFLWIFIFYMPFSAKIKQKEKEIAVVTMLVSKGYDNFVTDSANAPLIDSAKKYLDNIKDMIAAYDLELQITEQDDAVKKADQKKNNLIDDGVSLQKKKKNIQAIFVLLDDELGIQIFVSGFYY